MLKLWCGLQNVDKIKNVWGMMTKKIYDINFRSQNRDTLINFIEQTWDELSDDPLLIANLYSSMPRVG